jgi:uncharacterized membrane protein
MRITLWLHLLATVVWVGGMFFAHVALRPAVATLPPQVRLPLMAATLTAFFQWVGAAVATIVITGFVMVVAMGGFTAVGGHIHLMTLLGVLMALIFGYVVAVPFQRFRVALAATALEAAGAALAQVRRLVGINLILGLVTITIAVLGHDVVPSV